MEPNTHDNNRSGLAFIMGFAISGICLFWLFSSIDISSIIFKIKQANFKLILLAVFTTAFSYLLRSYRWIFFFEKSAPSFFNSFSALIYGFFMNNVLPARMGELVRAHVGGKLTGLSRAHVLATIAAERLADGLVISSFFALCYISSSEKIYHHQGLLYVSYLFLIAAVLTATLLWQQRGVFNFLEKLNNKFSGGIYSYSLKRAELFIEGLAPLFQLKRFVILTLLSMMIWGVELVVYYEISTAFGVELSLAGLSIFLVAVNFSSLIPAAPGGIGVIEAFATFILTQIGINKETALAMVATQHFIQIFVVGIAGAYVQVRFFGNKIPSAVEEAA